MSAHPAFMSVADYLASEPASPVRREYWNGLVFAMAGSSQNHQFISSNLIFTVRTLLANQPCMMVGADTRVWVEEYSSYYYPDGLIGCPLRYLDRSQGITDNPSVIFEILCPSTERVDRGNKFHAYRTLPSLVHYILISSEEQKVQVYTREDEQWVERTYDEGDVPVTAVGIVLSLVELYNRVEWS